MEFPEIDGVTVAATAFDVDSGDVLFQHQPDRVLRTASIGKLFLLHAVLELADRGELDLEERVARRPSDGVEDSGLWYLLEADALTVYDLCALIGAASDNLATNVLVRRLGLAAVHASTAGLGIRDSALHDVVRPQRTRFGAATLSSGTAAELAGFVARVARREILTPESCDVLRRWLAGGMDLSMVPAPLGLDPLAHDGFDRDLWLWNKTGTTSVVRGDVGVLSSPERRVAYAVLVNWDEGDRRDDAFDVMHAVGRELRSYVLA